MATDIEVAGVIDRLVEYRCSACHRTWSEVPTFDELPRAKPAKMLPRCQTCGESTQIRKETIVTSDIVREVFSCSRCGASWPAAEGGRSA
jgi:transposase-like protein